MFFFVEISVNFFFNKLVFLEFSWGTRMAIARDIAAGMEYLHRSSIIHRDLNSNNCLVKEVN